MKSLERLAQVVVAAVIAAVVTFGLTRGIFVAGGADWYGYVSQADLWAKGDLVIHQPFARDMTWPNASRSLAPLGYRPHTSDPQDKDIVPIYSPGVPMIMALFKIVGGARAVFYVVPLLGGVAVWATYLLGARLAGPLVGASAAVLLATSPSFLFEVVAPASDVACTAWWTLAFVLLTFERRWAAFASGVATGLAILTRPNLVPLAAIPALVLIWDMVKARIDGTRSSVALVRVLLFAAGSIPACLVVAAIDRTLYGGALTTGYGPFHALYSWSFLAENLRRYPRWLVDTETAVVLLAPVAPFVLPRRDADPSRARRPRLVAIVSLLFIGGAVLSYIFYIPAGMAWYDVRYLMPVYPPLLALTCAVVWKITAPLERMLSGAHVTVAALTIAAVAWHGVSFSLDGGAQVQWMGEQRYPAVGSYIASTLPERAVLICMQHSGSIRYYANRTTVRYDFVEPADLDVVVNRLRELGYSPYLVLDDWEEPQFRQRFAGHSALGALDWVPVARMQENRVSIYDATNR